MATTLYLRTGKAGVTGNGASVGRGLTLGRGGGSTNYQKDTLTGTVTPPTTQTQFTRETTLDETVIWVSNPLSSGVTISGTVTFNIWALESQTAANATITAELLRLNSSGNVQSVIADCLLNRTELTISSAAQNWTRTPTSTALSAGERLGLRVYIDDGNGVTMASGRTVTISINGPTASASGDSYVTVTENLSFNAETVVSTVKSSGGDYTSLAGWESAEQGDIATSLIINKAECYSFNDTLSVTIDGWTTSASYYIEVYAATGERHAGKWDGTKYNLTVANGSCIVVNEDYVRIHHLQLSVGSTSTGGKLAIQFGTGISTSACDVRAYNNITKQGTVSNGYTTGISFAYSASGTRTGYAWNNLCYDHNYASTGNGILTDGSWTVYFYNNTVVDNYNGIRRVGGTAYAKNNISFNNTDNYVGTFTSSDYNLSGPSQTDAPGANSKNGVTPTFVDSANDDWHLSSSDTQAKDNGVSDPGSGLFSDDLEGTARSGSWDIGCDEAESLVLLSRDGVVPADVLAPLNRDGTVSAEALVSLLRDTSVPAETLADLFRDGVILTDALAAIARDALLQSDWVGLVLVLRDAPQPMDWMLELRKDGGAGLDWLSPLDTARAMTGEWLADIRLDKTIPVESLVAAMKDVGIPVEWAGPVMLARDAALPLDILWSAAADASFPIDVSGPVGLNASLPADLVAGVLADRRAEIELLLELSDTAAINVEFGGVVYSIIVCRLAMKAPRVSVLLKEPTAAIELKQPSLLVTLMGGN